MPVGRIIQNLVRLPSGDIQLENSDAFCKYCEDDKCPISKFMPSNNHSIPVKGTTDIVFKIGMLPINMLEVPENCPLTPEVFINNGALELFNSQGFDEIIDPKDEDLELLRRFPTDSLLDSQLVLMPPSSRGKCVFCNLDCKLNPGYEVPEKTEKKDNKNQKDTTNQ